MSARFVDQLMGRYVRRFPGAEEADDYDSMYHWQLRMLRQVLAIVDMGMEDNGVDEAVRKEVLKNALYGAAPDAEAATERQREMSEKIAQLGRTAPRLADLINNIRAGHPEGGS